MLTYGIIGKPLEHSFSPQYFGEKFAREHIIARFERFELQSLTDFPTLHQQHPNLAGLNVTHPYKESIIPYLDELSPRAAEIGAVNVIQFKQGKLIGHNTDSLGFEEALKEVLNASNNYELCIMNCALILGTGGASKAVHYALKNLGYTVTFASRSADKGIPYENLNEDNIRQYGLIVNCTPVGMTPNINVCPSIPYAGLQPSQIVFDVIYNPACTLFLQKAKAQGCTVSNGLTMLHAQAEWAWKIWNEK